MQEGKGSEFAIMKSENLKAEKWVEDAEVCLERHGVGLAKHSRAHRVSSLFHYTCLKLVIKTVQSHPVE